jgi:hypothetical protein
MPVSVAVLDHVLYIADAGLGKVGRSLCVECLLIYSIRCILQIFLVYISSNALYDFAGTGTAGGHVQQPFNNFDLRFSLATTIGAGITGFVVNHYTETFYVGDAGTGHIYSINANGVLRVGDSDVL